MQFFKKGAARFVIFGVTMLCALSRPAAFADDWIKLDHPDFEVYSALNERDSKTVIETMILTDFMLRVLTGAGGDNTGERVPLKTILPKDLRDLGEIAPGINSNVVAYYLRSKYETMIVSPGLGTKNTDFLLSANESVNHEYTHHFHLNEFSDYYPPWFREGFASYIGTIRVDDGKVSMGWPSKDRATGLTRSKVWMSPDKMLNSSLRDLSKADSLELYDTGWISVHYLMSTDARRKMLPLILKAYEDDGRVSEPEFQAATGMSFKAFSKEIRSYFRGKASIWSIPKPDVSLADVKVTRLSKGDSEAILLYHRVSAGRINPKVRKKTLKSIERVAAKYPDSYYANLALVTYHAFNSPPNLSAQPAMDLALRYPDDARVTFIAGEAHLMAAVKRTFNKAAPEVIAKHFDDSEPYIKKAIRLNPKSYQAHYAMARLRQGQKRRPAEIHPHLQTAHDLAPQVTELTFALGKNNLARGNTGAGTQLLEQVAIDPHGGALSIKARKILKRNKDK